MSDALDETDRGPSECATRRAVQHEVCGETGVEQMLGQLLNENQQVPGLVLCVQRRLEEDVDTYGVAGNVEQQKDARDYQQHRRHLTS